MDNIRKDSTPIKEGKPSGPLKINTLGGSCDCRWDETSRMTVNWHLVVLGVHPVLWEVRSAFWMWRLASRC